MTISLTHLGSVTQGNVAGTATQVITTSAAVPAGSLICVLIQDKNTTTTAPTLTDSAGNTYILAQQQIRGSVTGTGYGCIYYAKNVTALPSGGTITATRPTANGVFVASAFYATGIDTANPLDTAVTAGAFAAGSANPSPTITSGTPTTAGSLFVALLTPTGSQTVTEDTADGWTNTPPNAVKSGSTTIDGAVNGAVQVNAGTGALTYTPTITSSSAWSIGVVAFKKATLSALNVTGAQTTNAVTSSSTTAVRVTETGAQTTNAATQSSAIQVMPLAANVSGAQNTLQATQGGTLGVTDALTGSQTTQAITQASAIFLIAAVTASQILSAATQVSDIHMVDPTVHAITGAQTLSAPTQTLTAAVLVKLTAAQTLASATQAGAIGVTQPLNVTGAQTTQAAQEVGTLYVPNNLTSSQTLSAATDTWGVNVLPYVVNISGAQTLSSPTPTSSINAPSGVQRISIGKQQNGVMGLRISQAGYDVRSNPVDQERLIFSSDWGEAMHIYLQGTSRINVGSGSSLVTQVPFGSLGYIPYVELILRSPNDAVGGSNWPDTTKYYPRQAISLATWAPYNGLDGAEFFRASITDGAIYFEAERRSQSNGFGLNASWWVYWTIFKRRVN